MLAGNASLIRATLAGLDGLSADIHARANSDNPGMERANGHSIDTDGAM